MKPLCSIFMPEVWIFLVQKVHDRHHDVVKSALFVIRHILSFESREDKFNHQGRGTRSFFQQAGQCEKSPVALCVIYRPNPIPIECNEGRNEQQGQFDVGTPRLPLRSFCNDNNRGWDQSEWEAVGVTAFIKAKSREEPLRNHVEVL